MSFDNLHASAGLIPSFKPPVVPLGVICTLPFLCCSRYGYGFVSHPPFKRAPPFPSVHVPAVTPGTSLAAAGCIPAGQSTAEAESGIVRKRNGRSTSRDARCNIHEVYKTLPQLIRSAVDAPFMMRRTFWCRPRRSRPPTNLSSPRVHAFPPP